MTSDSGFYFHPEKLVSGATQKFSSSLWSRFPFTEELEMLQATDALFLIWVFRKALFHLLARLEEVLPGVRKTEVS
jgi:hypothetical protein